MRTLVSLAWRNLWRNSRRTVLTGLAIAFAVALTVFTRGLQFGMYEQTIEHNVALGVGHVQLQHADYWDHKSLEHTFEAAAVDLAAIDSLPAVSAAAPRLATEALVALGDSSSTGARIEGIVPSREARLSVVPGRIVEGRWLRDDDTRAAAIGAVLARNLGAAVGDTLVYFTQGRHGALAAGLFAIRGIFDAGSQGIDAATVYVPLASLQQQLWADGRWTALRLRVADHRDVEAVADSLRSRYGGAAWRVMAYPELIPDIMSSIDFDRASGAVFLILVLVIAGFSILETLLMSVMERYHEFGVMMAVGLRRSALVGLILLEALFVALVGVVAGNGIGYGANAWLREYPIELTSMADMYQDYGFTPVLITLVDLGDQAFWTGVVLLITLIVALWPAWVVTRFRPVEAIRQV